MHPLAPNTSKIKSQRIFQYTINHTKTIHYPLLTQKSNNLLLMNILNPTKIQLNQNTKLQNIVNSKILHFRFSFSVIVLTSTFHACLPHRLT